MKNVKIPLTELTCSVCTAEYGTFQNTPISLECGHTFCSNCFERSSNCPTCRAPIRKKSKHSKNITLCNILDSETEEMCKTHDDEALKLFHKGDKELLCVNCLFVKNYSDLRGLIQLKDIQNRVKETKNVCEKISRSESKQKLSVFSQKRRDSLKRALDEAFDEHIEPLLALKKKLHLEADLAVSVQNGKYGYDNIEEKHKDFKQWKEKNIFLVDKWNQSPDGETASSFLDNNNVMVEKEFDKITEETLRIEKTIQEKSNRFLTELDSKLQLPGLREISSDIKNVVDSIKVENNPKLHLERLAHYLQESGIQFDMNMMTENSILKFKDEQPFMAIENEDQDFSCILEELCVDCGNLETSHFYLFCNTLKKIDNLKTFSIKVSLHDKNLLLLGESLRKVPSIEQFNGDFCVAENANEVTLVIFWAHLTQLPNLKKIQLKISNLDGKENLKSFKKIPWQLELFQLEEVKLSFNSLGNISQQGVGMIFKSLQSGVNIKKLSIEITGCEYFEMGTFEEFGRLCSALRSLEELSISFVSFNNVRNIDIGESISSLAKSIVCSEKLVKLHISFANTSALSTTALIVIFKDIFSSSIAKKLKDVAIDLYDCEGANDNFLIELSRVLLELTELTRFHLETKHRSVSLTCIDRTVEKTSNS